jgi:hypothetical protein
MKVHDNTTGLFSISLQHHFYIACLNDLLPIFKRIEYSNNGIEIINEVWIDPEYGLIITCQEVTQYMISEIMPVIDNFKLPFVIRPKTPNSNQIELHIYKSKMLP